MEQKKEHIFTPDSFVEWFKLSPHLAATMPWVANLTADKENLNKGCKCKHKAKMLNYKGVFRNMAVDIYGKNGFLVNQLKKELEVDLITFQIDSEIIASY